MRIPARRNRRFWCHHTSYKARYTPKEESWRFGRYAFPILHLRQATVSNDVTLLQRKTCDGVRLEPNQDERLPSSSEEKALHSNQKSRCEHFLP